MAKVVKLTYVDADKDAPEVTVFGKVLKDGESVEVPEEEAERYKTNRFFKVGPPTEKSASAEQQPAEHKAAPRK